MIKLSRTWSSTHLAILKFCCRFDLDIARLFYVMDERNSKEQQVIQDDKACAADWKERGLR